MLIPCSVFMKKFFENLKNKISSYYNSLNTNQRLIFTSIIVVILAVIILIVNIVKNNNPVIDYNNTAAVYFGMSSNINNKNDYAIVKSVADSFQEEMKNYPDYSTNKKRFNDFYKYCVYPKYKNIVSMKSFHEKARNFFENTISTDGVVDYIDDIGYVKDNFYILRYKKVDGENVIYSYLGIVIEPTSSRYYIWYIE